jgi:division protein CdvB (Snf7/Vps24/ESCRT-III family)
MSDKPDNQELLDALDDSTDDSDDVMYEQDAHNIDSDLSQSYQSDIDILVLALERNTGVGRLDLSEFIYSSLETDEVKELSQYAIIGQGDEFIKVMRGLMGELAGEEDNVTTSISEWVNQSDAQFIPIRNDIQNVSENDLSPIENEEDDQAAQDEKLDGGAESHAEYSDFERVVAILHHNTGIDQESLASFVGGSFTDDTIQILAENYSEESSEKFFDSFWAVMEGMETEENSVAFHVAKWASESNDTLLPLTEDEVTNYIAAAGGADGVELDFDVSENEGQDREKGLFGLTAVQCRVYGTYAGLGLLVVIVLGGMGAFFASQLSSPALSASDINYSAFDFVEPNAATQQSNSAPQGIQNTNGQSNTAASSSQTSPEPAASTQAAPQVRVAQSTLENEEKLAAVEARLDEVVTESTRAFNAIESRLNRTLERENATTTQLNELALSIQSIQQQLNQMNNSVETYNSRLERLDSQMADIKGQIDSQGEEITEVAESNTPEPVPAPSNRNVAASQYPGTRPYCVLTAITGTAYVKSYRTGRPVRLERGDSLIGYGRILSIRPNGDIVTENPVSGSQVLMKRSCNY